MVPPCFHPRASQFLHPSHCSIAPFVQLATLPVNIYDINCPNTLRESNNMLSLSKVPRSFFVARSFNYPISYFPKYRERPFQGTSGSSISPFVRLSSKFPQLAGLWNTGNTVEFKARQNCSLRRNYDTSKPIYLGINTVLHFPWLKATRSLGIRWKNASGILSTSLEWLTIQFVLQFWRLLPFYQFWAGQATISWASSLIHLKNSTTSFLFTSLYTGQRGKQK